MEAEAVEFHDWEVLQKIEDTDQDVNSASFVGIESDSDGGIRSDYFSLDGQSKYAKTAAEGGDMNEEGSAESDNPSWIDPATETRYGRKNSSEFWSDSSSDRSEERKFGDLEATNELASEETMKFRMGSGEMEDEQDKFREFRPSDSKLGDLDVINELNYFDSSKGQEGLQDFGEINGIDKSSEKFFSDSGGDGLGYANNVKISETSEFSSELDNEINSKKLMGEEEQSEECKSVAEAKLKLDDEGEKRGVVWWKVPFEVLKYCVFKMSPVWSFSVAAAFMGFLLLGRRLYKMKRKTQSLKLKVTVDDKKVSQFMGRAARLNEAFSVVRRVPVIRPSLPASGVTPWPVMSMR